tara:strand:+ start:344 stop:700 length:357 start_codon:yes stop_codon:yes gene_type:complete
MDPITVQSYPLTKTGKPSTGATLTLTRERARLGGPFQWAGGDVLISHGSDSGASTRQDAWVVEIGGRRIGGRFDTVAGAVSARVRDHITIAADTVEQDTPACWLCGNHERNDSCHACN